MPYHRLRNLARYSVASLLAILVGILYFGAWTRNLIPKGAEWKNSGTFALERVSPSTKFDAGVNPRDLSGLAFWGSWSADGQNTGELLSPQFRAPSILELFVAGYPGKPLNGIFLEREDTHARLPLLIPRYFEPGARWENLHWMLPHNWRERSVHLIAMDGERGSQAWLGISSPRQISLAELFRNQLPAALVVLVYALNLALFLLPGLAIAMTIAARHRICDVYMVILTIVGSSALGYLAFWAYFGNKMLGKTFSLTSVAISIFTVVVILRTRTELRTTGKRVAIPFLYVLVVGICYLCLLFVFGNPFPSGASLVHVRFFNQVRPDDNLIPLIFADRIYAHEPIKPFCCDGWLSSDRPPLQAGIFLFVRPFRLLADEGLNYQCLGTALQCLWLCGVWSLLKSLRARDHRIRQVLGFLAFSGFFFQNSVNVWPKLLAATFILFGLSILLRTLGNNRPITSFEIVLAVTSFSLAAMAHPGSLFSLPAFLLILIPKIRLLPRRGCVLSAIVIVMFVVPWMAYQKFYDPPGNRLLKMHLAGAFAIDSRSTWQTVKDAYSKWDVNTYFRFKATNISTIIGPELINSFGITAIHVNRGLRLDRTRLEHSRFVQEQYIWNAIGILNLGWLAAIILWLKRKKNQALQHSTFIVKAAVLNLIVWSLVMFGPRQTFTTNSSFADIILLSVGLCGFLVVLSPVVVIPLFALQVFNLFVVWVFSPPDSLNLQAGAGIGPVLQLPLLLIGMSCAAGLAYHFVKSYLRRSRTKASLRVSDRHRRGATLLNGKRSMASACRIVT